MSHLLAFIQTLFPHIPSQKERDLAYLNQSADIYDVERRMQEIDARPRHAFLPALDFHSGARS